MSSAEHSAHATSRLCNFHITFFAIVLGLAGFTLSVQKAGGLLHALHPVSTALLYLTVGLFAWLVPSMSTRGQPVRAQLKKS